MDMNEIIEPRSFHIAFQVRKRIIFEVDYYRCGRNKHKYFSTSASELNRNRTDYSRCGQGQEDLLSPKQAAYTFFKKWDFMHTLTMTNEQYYEMLNDLDMLKMKYDYIENSTDYDISFRDIVELDRKGRFNKR